jgi:anti-anti-sigma factor
VLQDLNTDGRGDLREVSKAAGRPRLRVQTIERTAIFRFVDAEILFAEADVQAVGDQLKRLVEDGGHSRLLLNLTGVRCMSCAVLGILANLQKKIGPAGGRIQLCGLDPLLRDMVRITHLDTVFDVCTNEAEALGLLVD